MRVGSLLLAGFWCLSPAWAQTYERNLDYVPVYHDGRLIPLAFAGGTYIPKAQFVDIDADGDPDLFITQVDGRVTFLLNTGTAAAPSYQWETDHYGGLEAQQWARFADMDGDGDFDLFVNRPGSRMGYFENTGTPGTASFTQRTDEVVDVNGSPILSEDPSVPCLADIDGDGDLDFFTGRSLGTVALYTNSGTPSQPQFTFTTDAFEDIVIITPAKRLMHGASSVTFNDIDDDGDQDLFWGDFFSSGMYYLENLGSPSDPDIPDTTTSTFPSRELLTRGFNGPIFADLDGDGDSELLVGVLYRDEDIDNFWYYHNDGTPAEHHFTLVTRNFLESIDVGRQSRPVTADIDGDGDLDLFTGSYDGHVIGYRNTGTTSVPVFEKDSTLNVQVPDEEFIASPALADLDGDGDLDLVAGFFTGRLSFFENTGTALSPAFVLASSSFAGIDIGNNAAPCFGDVDGDHDADLFVGRNDGRVSLYRNFGTTSSFQFHADSVVADYLPSSVGQDAVPQCLDIDHDGDPDIFAGNKSGELYFFENRGSASSPSFVLNASGYKAIKTTLNAAPCFSDIDADGDFDLFLGNIKGGVEFYLAASEAASIERISNQVVIADSLWILHIQAAGSPTPRIELLQAPAGMTWDSGVRLLSWRPGSDDEGRHLIRLAAINQAGTDTAHFRIDVINRIALGRNFPNPFNGSTTIEFTLHRTVVAELTIYNVLGQPVRRLIHRRFDPGIQRIPWDGLDESGRSAASGVYVCRLTAGTFAQTRKILLVK